MASFYGAPATTLKSLQVFYEIHFCTCTKFDNKDFILVGTIMSGFCKLDHKCVYRLLEYSYTFILVYNSQLYVLI